MARKKKPVYRARNIVIAISLLLVVAIGHEVYLAVTAEPGASENFPAKVAALIEAGQPAGVPVDSPNAVEILDRAIVIESEVRADYLAREPTTGGHPPVDYSLLRGPMSTQPYGKQVFEQIKANSRQVITDLGRTEFSALLDQAAAARRAVPARPLKGQVIGFMLPNLGKYRNLARLNGARMYLAHQAGDEEELVRAYEQTLALGRIAGHGSFLIEYLVAIAIDALATGELREEMVERVPSEAALIKMLGAMDRQSLPSMATVIEGERLSVLDTIQWTHTDDGRGSGRLIASKAAEISAMWGGGFMGNTSSWKIMNLAGAAFPSKAANVRKADQFFAHVRSVSAKPNFARGDTARELDAMVDGLPARYVLLRMLLPAWGKTMQSWDQLAASWEGTRVMIAVEVFRHRQGRYPAGLDELAPGVLSQVPVDPYSGKHFGYRLLEPGSDRHGRGYLLYTVGADGVDQGGTTAKSNHDAFRAGVGKGFDFVLNEPRMTPEPEAPEVPESETPEAPPDTPPPEAAASQPVSR